MIGWTRSVRVWAYSAPTDMRKGYDGLSAVVRQHLAGDPFCGDVYLFVNRRRSRAKLLLFDGTGMCIYMKRLQKGRFAAPWYRPGADALQLTVSELGLFLEGCELVFRRVLSPEPVLAGDLQVVTSLG